jgi:orotidine-5'-phosphate decarboxylase
MSEYKQDFLKKYQKARDEKESILCAGFDPAVPGQRKNNTIPNNFFKKRDSIEQGILAYFKEYLEKVKNECCAIKANQQYLFALSFETRKEMNKQIHNEGLVSILDLKIGDIGSSNQSGFYWIKEMGYDAVTYNPFSGNIKESIQTAHYYGVGLITLTLMSNPQAIHFMKESTINSKKGYEFIAQQLNTHQGDGMVVGATGHVTEEDLKTIRKLAGKDVIMLIPGIGKQKGDLQKVIIHGGDNILLNVGRAIMYASDIKKTVREYNQRFNEVRNNK